MSIIYMSFGVHTHTHTFLLGIFLEVYFLGHRVYSALVRTVNSFSK